MVRDIIASDKAEVLRLVKMFFAERLERAGSHFSYQHADAHFEEFIKFPGLVALCAEEEGRLVGMIAGVKSSIIFAKEVALQELVWYVEPESRKCGLHLLREFERRAEEMGASQILMIGMSKDPIVPLYARLGYTEIQLTFMKRL